MLTEIGTRKQAERTLDAFFEQINKSHDLALTNEDYQKLIELANSIPFEDSYGAEISNAGGESLTYKAELIRQPKELKSGDVIDYAAIDSAVSDACVAYIMYHDRVIPHYYLDSDLGKEKNDLVEELFSLSPITIIDDILY